MGCCVGPEGSRFLVGPDVGCCLPAGVACRMGQASSACCPLCGGAASEGVPVDTIGHMAVCPVLEGVYGVVRRAAAVLGIVTDSPLCLPLLLYGDCDDDFRPPGRCGAACARPWKIRGCTSTSALTLVRGAALRAI